MNMEEIRFKPKARIEIFFLPVFIILLILGTIIILPLGTEFISFLWLFFLPVLYFGNLVIKKVFTTYTITDNEIEIFYQFISKESKVYRVDQFTSVELSRNWFEKIFGLGTINFGVFGGNNSVPSSKNPILSYSLKTISNYDEVFGILCKNLNLNNKKEIYLEKPSLKPVNFYLVVSFLLIFISLGLILFPLNLETGFYFQFLIIGGVLLLISLIMLISNILTKLELKTSNYLIGDMSVIKNYDYVFSKTDFRVPINKITNTDINKNLIAYSLFKVGSVKIYTGGSYDPFFNNLDHFEVFYENLRDIVKQGFVSEKNSKVKSEEKRNVNKGSESESHLTRPGSSFIITYMFYVGIVFFSLCLYIYFYLSTFFNISILIFGSIFFILLILRMILWNNTKYEFFDNKINVTTGIIDITKKEAYYKNVKHIKLRRGLLFDRILKQGTIYIYTPGTVMVDKKISSIKDYKEIYRDLKEVLVE